MLLLIRVKTSIVRMTKLQRSWRVAEGRSEDGELNAVSHPKNVAEKKVSFSQ